MLPSDAAVGLELGAVVNAHWSAAAKADRDGKDGLDEADARRLLTRALAAVDRAAPPGSSYRNQVEEVMSAGGWIGWKATQLVAIVEALRDDYQDGVMQSVAELVHADLFGDLLDMAVELHHKQFVGPAAIVAGAVLEEHVRKLATKQGFALAGPNGRHKSVDQVGVELRGAGVLSEVERKALAAWYAQRNEAAHGRFSSLVDTEVERMIDAVRDFVARHPA